MFKKIERQEGLSSSSPSLKSSISNLDISPCSYDALYLNLAYSLLIVIMRGQIEGRYILRVRLFELPLSMHHFISSLGLRQYFLMNSR